MSPAKAAKQIILMGLIFTHFVPTNVATNKPTLIQNCHGFTFGVEKFSSFISKSVAAASRPTTTGRKAVKMFCTSGVSIYFMTILLMSIIKMSEGKTKANVAVNEPNTAIVPLYPAF